MLVYFNNFTQGRDTVILILYQLLLSRMLQNPQIVKVSNIRDKSKFKNNSVATHFHNCYICQSQKETGVKTRVGVY